MTQEQKDLLLKDICTRLPYGVKGKVSRCDSNNRECEFVATIDGKLYDRFAVFQESWYDNVIIKPYLFPLSSMTDEQYNEFFTYFHEAEKKEIETSGDYLKAAYLGENAKRDWLNKNHFDYHYLIPLGLANDATGLNIY